MKKISLFLILILVTGCCQKHPPYFRTEKEIIQNLVEKNLQVKFEGSDKNIYTNFKPRGPYVRKSYLISTADSTDSCRVAIYSKEWIDFYVFEIELYNYQFQQWREVGTYKIKGEDIKKDLPIYPEIEDSLQKVVKKINRLIMNPSFSARAFFNPKQKYKNRTLYFPGDLEF